MDYSWRLLAVYAAAVFGALKTLCAPACSGWVVDACLCLLSAVFADTLVKITASALPRRLLPHLQNKAVLLTGCDTGFGNLCARRLDALGVTVFAGCLLPDGPDAADLRASTSGSLHVVPLDVTDDRQVSDAADYVARALQGKELCAVVNNAGIGVVGEVDWCAMECLQQVMDVNTYGVVRVTKAFLPMIKKSKGRVVVLSSLAGRVGLFAIAYYSMSKSAVQRFGEALRKEMRKWSVSVHGIEPGAFNTGITSPKNVSNMITKSWEKCPKDIQSAYGKEYIDAFEDSSNCFKNRFSSHRLHEVVDDMVDAAVGLTPKIRYGPGFLLQLLARISSLLPSELEDYMHEILLQLKKKPAALEAEKKYQ